MIRLLTLTSTSVLATLLAIVIVPSLVAVVVIPVPAAIVNVSFSVMVEFVPAVVAVTVKPSPISTRAVRKSSKGFHRWSITSSSWRITSVISRPLQKKIKLKYAQTKNI